MLRISCRLTRPALRIRNCYKWPSFWTETWHLSRSCSSQPQAYSSSKLQWFQLSFQQLWMNFQEGMLLWDCFTISFKFEETSEDSEAKGHQISDVGDALWRKRGLIVGRYVRYMAFLSWLLLMLGTLHRESGESLSVTVWYRSNWYSSVRE